MELSQAIAEEQGQLAAVLADLRRQQEEKAQHSSGKKPGIKGAPAAASQGAPEDVAIRIAAKQVAPDPLAAFDDELADVSVIDQHTTSPAAPSTEDLEAAPCRSSAPANTAAASEAAATPPASPDLSEEAQADSTAAQIVTPFDLFASEELSSAHIADTQAAADSGQDLSHLTPQSSPVGASSSSVSERFPARYHERPEASLAAARSGLLPAQAEGTQGHKGIFEGLLASQSTSVEYAEASQQHPAAAEPDPVRLSGEQLSTTIEKLLEAYQPGTPLAAQGKARTLNDGTPGREVPMSPEEAGRPYTSLANIRRHLAERTQHNTKDGGPDAESSLDGQVVAAWLQVSTPGLDLSSALKGAASASPKGGVKSRTFAGDITVGEGIANILAEAVAHAEQCLTLIASAQERPDVKALDALMVAKQLNIRLSAMSAADAVAEEDVDITETEASPPNALLTGRAIAGRPFQAKHPALQHSVGRVSTAVILIWLLALAWKAMEEYQRSRRWPPPV